MSARPVPLRPLFLAALASLALVVLANQTTLPPQPYRAQGAEGELNRAQQWLVPTPAADRGAHALLFRPPGEGPFRLAVIAHASSQNALRRTQMTAPEYRALAAFLVAHGLAVLVPERLGHGEPAAPIWRIKAAARTPTMQGRHARLRSRSSWRWIS